MFVVLDTNHFAELVQRTALGGRLKARFHARKAQVFTTIITAQEVTEGWSAFIRKQKAGTPKQIHGYAQFQHSLELLMAPFYSGKPIHLENPSCHPLGEGSSFH